MYYFTSETLDLQGSLCLLQLPLHFHDYLYYYSLKSLLNFLASSAGITEGFSMCGGDFVEVYSDPSQVGKTTKMISFIIIKINVLVIIISSFLLHAQA